MSYACTNDKNTCMLDLEQRHDGDTHVRIDPLVSHAAWRTHNTDKSCFGYVPFLEGPCEAHQGLGLWAS